MPDGPETGQPPEIVREPAQDVHEYRVDRIRDVTREGKIVLQQPYTKGMDTAFRQLFPTTYDLVLDHPETKETAEDQ
jgi:hypothetical protein